MNPLSYKASLSLWWQSCHVWQHSSSKVIKFKVGKK